MGRNAMIKNFQILAVILAGTAAFFWWQENNDAAFAAGVCAGASYFLSMRFQMKARIKRADEEKEAAVIAEKEALTEKDDK